MKIKIYKLIVGLYEANCYIIKSEESLSGIIIDPGDESERIKKLIKEHNINVKMIFLTHAHFDHILGLNQVKDEAKICLNREDLFLYENLRKQANTFGFSSEPIPPVDLFINDSDIIEIDDIIVNVIHTPGHSPGSCCFKIDNYLFSGDTLFNMGIGRTDLWGGSYEKLMQSINDKIFTLDENIVVYPGHGEKTIIKDEKKSFLI